MADGYEVGFSEGDPILGRGFAIRGSFEDLTFKHLKVRGLTFKHLKGQTSIQNRNCNVTLLYIVYAEPFIGAQHLVPFSIAFRIGC